MNLAASTPAATPAPQLRDIVPPQAYHLPGDFLLLALGAGALAAAAYLAWRLWRRPKKAEPPLTPRQLAEQRLAELRRRAPELEPRSFGAEVSAILVAYIGATYAFHPERQTTAEFLDALSGRPIFAPAEHAALGGFLAQCDLLKYARHDAAAEAKEGLLEQTREFIELATASLPSAVAGETIPRAARVPA